LLGCKGKVGSVTIASGPPIGKIRLARGSSSARGLRLPLLPHRLRNLKRETE